MKNQKKKPDVSSSEEYEVCVMCGVLTNIPRSMPLEMCTDYFSGAGQLCHKCAETNVSEERTAMRNGFLYALPYYEKE